VRAPNLQTSLDVDQLYQTSQITSSPRAEYSVQLTTPGTYTVWLRGYPANAAGDSVYVGTKNQKVGVTGFAPGQWSWAKLNLSSGAATTLPLTTTGLVTVGLWMREDGLQIDRVLLTTDTNYIPTGFGPAESTRLINQTTLSTTITRTIVYTYDDLYRLTNANYSTGELFAYTYDPAGNRRTQTTLAGTNVYTYDAANRLTQVDGVTYGWDNNGNLLNDGSRTFTYDTANRLTAVTQGATTTQFAYNGDGDRLAQIVAGVTTKYALDPTGLAKVLIASTSGQNQYYLSGLAQYDSSNGWSYFAKDRVRSIRQLVASNGQVSLAQSYDPFGNVLQQTGSGQSIFGYTGEQVDPTGLVFLRARYYHQALGRFLTADSIIPDPLRSIGWNRYAYAVNNPVRYVDPSGLCGETPLEDDGETVLDDPCEGGPGGSPPAGGLGGGFGGGRGGGYTGGGGSSGTSGGSFIPNPNGKSGGPAHQTTIEALKRYITTLNWQFRKEFYVKTPGGYKNSRFIDIAALDAHGNPVMFCQVGDLTKSGVPVMRERKAIIDVITKSNYDVPLYFIPKSTLK